MTYADLNRAISTRAAEYRDLGVGPGDRVVCQLRNSPEFVVSAAATWRCGGIHVGANTDMTTSEMDRLVSHIRPRVVLVNEQPWPVRSPAHRAAPQPPGPDAPALILVTSGTTASPKHVIRYHGELASRWWAGARQLGVMAGDSHLVQLPLSHGFGLGLAIGALLTGGKLVLMDRFSPGAAVELIEHERISVLNGAPPHFQLLVDWLADPENQGSDISSLRVGHGSGAGFHPALVRRIFDELHMRLSVAYGCSEGLGWTTSAREDLIRGSVGRPPPTELRVVSIEDHTPLKADKVGEIAIRMSRPVCYWGDSSPAGASSGEWYFTGDIGRCDHQGRLYVLGRVGDQINRGGVWVDPGEVEAALRMVRSLGDLAVVGVPDRVLGEVVCACVTPLEAAPTLDEIRAALATRLSRHKLPEMLCVLSEIPRTPLGKADRTALREIAAASSDRLSGRG